jgi:macrodomain Ter protein organizer (MatP/YcbG family)
VCYQSDISKIGPVKVYQDNRPVKVDNLKDNMMSSRHIKRWLKSVRKMRNSRVITLDYIHTEKNLVDPFTKRLSRNVIDAASKEMGLRPTKAIP